jgi:hypothetical protein
MVRPGQAQDAPYAKAFLTLVDELGLVAPPAAARPGPLQGSPGEAHSRVRVVEGA